MTLRFRNLFAFAFVSSALFAQVIGDPLERDQPVPNGYPTIDATAKATTGEDFVLQFVNLSPTKTLRLAEYDSNAIAFKEAEHNGDRMRFIFSPLTVGSTIFLIEELEGALTRVFRYTVAISAGNTNTPAAGPRVATNSARELERATDDQREYQIALDMFNSKLYTQAETAFNDVASRFHLSEYAGRSLARIADIAFDQSNYADAVTKYDAVIKSVSAPEDEMIAAYLKTGRALVAQKKYEDAIPFFLHVEKFFPDSALAGDALYYAAESYLALGRADAAKGALERAFETYPDFTTKPDALFLVGSVYDTGGAGVRDIQKARDSYDAYLKAYPRGSHAKAATDRIRYLDENYLHIR